MATLTTIPRPDIAVPAPPPPTPAAEYDRRLRAAADAIARLGLDVLVVYADREHCGDMSYLCGVDPRFEEGLLFLDRNGGRVIYLGNECQNYGPDPALGISQRLYQELSPQGQVRNQPIQLAQILADVGITAGTRVGTAGGKSFTAGYVADPLTSHWLPAFVVDALRQAAGSDAVVNAEEIFLGPRLGLRVAAVSALEILQCEYAAAATSQSVRGALLGIRPGVSEIEVADRLFTHGLPDSAHPMVNFGAKAARGLSSPTAATAARGAAFQVAQGLRGGLTCRAGAIAAGPQDLAPAVADRFPALIANYFDVMLAWYAAVKPGATTGEVFDACDKIRDGSVFRFALNPGHYLHIEEWSVSTFAPRDATPLRSGMLLQGDIIPVVDGPFCTVNVEDGIALADQALQADLAALDPGFPDRVAARRQFLRDHIGLDLDSSVLPLSSTPLWHTPYVLSPRLALTAS